MIEVARAFRKEPTRGEAILWSAIRGKQLNGVKFRRQQPVGPFVVDFYAAKHRLIVEVDGPVHESQRDADEDRQGLLESLGLRMCRIRTELVEHDVSAALDMILASLSKPLPGSAITEVVE